MERKLNVLDLRQYTNSTWPKWFDKFNRRFEHRFPKMTNSQRTSLLIRKMGKDAFEIFKALEITEDVDFFEVVRRIDLYFQPLYAKFVFFRRKQNDYETFDKFASALTLLSYPCLFGPYQGIVVRDIFVANLHQKYEHIRMILLKQKDPTLTEILTFMRSYYVAETLPDPKVVTNVASRLDKYKISQSKKASCADMSTDSSDEECVDDYVGAMSRINLSAEETSVQRDSFSGASKDVLDNGIEVHTLAEANVPPDLLRQQEASPAIKPPDQLATKHPSSSDEYFDVVVISTFEDKDVVYVSLPDKFKLLCEVMKEIWWLIEKNRLDAVEKFFVNELYAAPRDSTWFRAQLVYFSPPAVLVKFIDYGDSVEIDPKLLRCLPKRLKSVDPLSFPVILSRKLQEPLMVGSNQRIKRLSQDEQNVWRVDIES